MLGSLNFVGLRNFLWKFAVSHIHTFSIVFVAKLHLNFAFSHTILMRVIQIMLIEIHLVQYSNTYTHLPGQIHQMFTYDKHISLEIRTFIAMVYVAY
jgi:hypothetical protein